MVICESRVTCIRERCICSRSRRVTNLKRPTNLGSLAMSILTWTSLGHMPKNLELYFNDDQTMVLSFFQTKKLADNYFVKHKPKLSQKATYVVINSSNGELLLFKLRDRQPSRPSLCFFFSFYVCTIYS